MLLDSFLVVVKASSLDFNFKGQVALTFKQQVKMSIRLKYYYVIYSVFPSIQLKSIMNVLHKFPLS